MYFAKGHRSLGKIALKLLHSSLTLARMPIQNNSSLNLLWFFPEFHRRPDTEHRVDITLQ